MHVEDVQRKDLVGVLYRPDGAATGGVLVLGGSEGGVPTEITRALAAHTGLVCFGLAYFNAPGLPRHLIEIPLEYVEGAVGWLKRQLPDPTRAVGLFGASKGAELALLGGATFPALFSALVAFVPSSVVFEGIGSRGRCGQSSWTHGGHPLPFVPYRGLPRPGIGGFRAATMYKGALASGPGPSVISVERIRCPLLLVSAGDDRLWPSTALADQVATRMQRHGGTVEHLCYPEAGHLVTLPVLGAPRPLLARLADMGGTRAANRAAAEDAWPKAIGFLRRAWPDGRSP